jgi:Transposase IS66 family
MGNGLPNIAPEERTPVVLALLDIIQQQREAIQQLRDEIARLKGQKPKPQIQPSRLEQPAPRPSAADDEKRPGSQKRAKNAELTIHREVRVPVPNPPAGSVSLGYEPYVVQELVIQAEVTRYLRERVQTAEGGTLLAPLPSHVLPGLHFGPTLICYIRHQYHHNHVTQPLLLEQLRQFGIDISAGQLNRLLTEDLDRFHREKEELLPAGLHVSAYVGVDDTGARHQGKTGFCTHIGNELFAYFESTDTKSRLNFLEILRRPHTDYVINDVALAYWQRQKLPAEIFNKLVPQPPQFADALAWQRGLQKLAITVERHVRIATEGALLGSLIAHGVSPHLVVLSDGAAQFDVLVHASCWIHAERPLARLVPSSEEQRAVIESVRQQIWELYQDLKAYQQQPEPARQPSLIARFEALVGQRTDFPSVNSALKEMRDHQADLLRVLERPEVPLHNNISEAHVRDYVKKRKISGSTRSQAGRRCRDTFASLKKTCRRLGVNFWAYLQDRVRDRGQIPRLVDLLRQGAAEAQIKIVAAVHANSAIPRCQALGY